jgi:hypothetical protein
MNGVQFTVPVRIVAAPGGTVTEIYSAVAALNFLIGWERGRQGPVYGEALDACACAIEGLMSAEDARKSFVRFSRVSGILAKDVYETVAMEMDGDLRMLPPKL